MRKRLVTVAAAAVLATPLLGGVALAGPVRPAGFPVSPSANGGDNGWGNCGHNSSGGAAHSGTQGNGGGNGGYTKGDCTADTSGGGGTIFF